MKYLANRVPRANRRIAVCNASLLLAFCVTAIGLLASPLSANASDLAAPSLLPSSSPSTAGIQASALGAFGKKVQSVKPADEPFGSVTLTFEGLPEYTPVTDQYEDEGALFFGAEGDAPPFIVSDRASSTNPTLSGSPLFEGAIGVEFVEPGTTTPTEVSGFSVLVGYINNPDSTQIDVYSCHGVSIVVAEEEGFNTLTSNAGCIYGFVVEEVSYEAAGYEIDNLSYTPGTSAAQGLAGGALNAFETLGGSNPAEPACSCATGWSGDPVNTATGDFTHTWTDAAIPGKGPSLNLSRTYNSLASASAGIFGYGWSSSYDMHLDIASGSGNATVVQGDGAQVEYIPTPAGFRAAPRVTASLVENGDGTYTFTTDHRLSYIFNPAGELTTIRDLNGYEITISRPTENEMLVTDSSGRSLQLTLEHGHVVSMSDPLGRTVHYTYNSEGDLVKVSDPLGRTTIYTYDDEHRLLTWTDPRGGTLTNQYDSSGRVIKQTDPMGRATTFDYGPDGVTTITDPRGNATTETYHEGFRTERTLAAGTPDAATWKYTYDPITGGQTTVTDPLGHTTTRTYDTQGNALTYTDALGRTTTYTYDALNDLASETDPLGITTTYTYDGAGNLLTKSTPLTTTGQEAQTTYSYEGEPGEVTSVTDPDGHTTTYAYDNAGDRTSMTDPDGNTTGYTYDADGELTSKTTPDGNASGGDPSAHTTSYTYDADRELISETDPLGHTTSYSYDGDGNRVAITDANGHTTQQTYDADNELTQVTRPDGSTLETQWDADGNMTAQIDGAGHATTYAYDPLNRVISVTDPDGHITSYRYDAAGRKTAMVNAEGETTEYSYDAAGELTGITYSDRTTPSITEVYDADGDRTELTDGSGTSTFTYDSLGRMTSATDGSGATVKYEYDLDGQLITLTYPNGKTVSRSYDAAGHLESVTDWLGNTTRFAYDADANLTGEQYPNGVNTQFTYDDADRVAGITDTNGGDTLASFSYTRDPIGDVTSETADNGEQGTTTYTHDALEQLTSANGTPYGYDAANNPTTFGDTTQSFDPANELTSSTTPGEVEGEGSKESAKESPAGTQIGSTTGGTTTTATPEAKSGVEAIHASYTPPTVDALVSVKSKGQGKLASPKLRTHRSHDLVLAFISASGPASGVQRITHVSGDGLHWSLVTRSDGASGAVEIWQAHALGRLSGAVTVRLRVSGYPADATIAAFAGSSPHLVAHATSQGHSSVPSNRLIPAAGTLLWAVGHSTGQKRAMRPHAGQRLVSQFFDHATHSGGWVQQTNAPSTAAGIADTTPSGYWGLVAVSIGSQSVQATRADRVRQIPATNSNTNTPNIAAHANSNAVPSLAGRADGNAVPHVAGRATPSTSELVTRQFTYTAGGERTSETTPGSPTVTFSYDQEDRLIGVGSNISYAYNGDGLRVSKTVNGTTTAFVWNQAEGTPELLQDGSTYYIYGPEGKPIEQISGETPTYLHQDQQGSTRLLTDASGTVVGRYDYDAWGNITSHTGSATTDLQYDGQYTDPETGFQYLRARYYDPSTGQFLTQDPAFSTTQSRYGYASNQPVDQRDPSGLWAIAICGGASGQVAAIEAAGVSGEDCFWEGGTGLLPSWQADTFTVTASGGVGLRAGANLNLGGQINWSISTPQQLAGVGCSISVSGGVVGGASLSAGCGGDSFGAGVSFGPDLGASAGVGVGATDVLWSSTGYSGWGPGGSPFPTDAGSLVLNAGEGLDLGSVGAEAGSADTGIGWPSCQ
jgi:RHS repeat-associated protein